MEAMDLEATPEEMESKAVHEEVPKEEAAAKSSGVLNKWHRGRHLAAEGQGELVERTRGNCGSWKKLAATSRKITRHAGVA
jgi:hypothetical protein